MDIRSTCLDRQGQPERFGEPEGRRPVGIEELGIDQVEGGLFMQCPGKG